MKAVDAVPIRAPPSHLRRSLSSCRFPVAPSALFAAKRANLNPYWVRERTHHSADGLAPSATLLAGPTPRMGSTRPARYGTGPRWYSTHEISFDDRRGFVHSDQPLKTECPYMAQAS